MIRLFSIVAAGALLLTAGPAAYAQQQEQDAPTRSVLEGVFTEAQAERGEELFENRCSLCHSPQEFSGSGWVRSWTGSTIQQLYRLISTTMPYDSPGGLEEQQYVDVISHILRLNGFPTGEAELVAEAELLNRIRIVEDTTGSADPEPPGRTR